MTDETTRRAPSSSADVFEIQRYSTEDGPGIRTTVFFKQCPLRCAWCQNPEGVDRAPSIQWFKTKCIGCESCIEACPENALSRDGSGIHIDRKRCKTCNTCVDACPSTALKAFGHTTTIDAIVGEVAKDAAYYAQSGGGITASGGEPLVQADAVILFFSACKARGMSTALETCGVTTVASIGRILPHVDLIMYDLKEIDTAKHKVFTGMGNERILENCRWIAEHLDGRSQQLWIRTPIVPGYTATEENVKGLAKFIRMQLKGKVQRWDLLAFNNLPADKYERMDKGEWVLKGTPLLTRREMEAYQEFALASGVPCVCWSGMTRVEDE